MRNLTTIELLGLMLAIIALAFAIWLLETAGVDAREVTRAVTEEM